jgi:hypothetical protein
MDQTQMNPEESRDEESLANLPPARIGDGEGLPMRWLPWGVVVVIVGGGMWALMDSSTGCARGATRSSKLRWELQQADIDAAAFNRQTTQSAIGSPHQSANHYQ